LSLDSGVCIENHNILKCHYNILKKKLSFYGNFSLSQYLFIAIFGAKILCGKTGEKISIDYSCTN